MTKIARGEFTVSSLYDGKTAYEVAVEGGFKGTEEEWLESLRGEDGVSITSVDVEYAQSESNSTPPTTGWGTNAPVWKDGNYIWSRTKTTYSTGNPTYSYPACITGEKGSDGRGIESIIEEFYLSTSREELLDGEWLEAPPTWLTGRYMWFRSKIIYKNPESIEYTTPNVDTAWESLDGVSLRDKTDILSGTEIYTDKADDDSVVHVEVDGKSVLQAPVGEGRNLLPNTSSDWRTVTFSGWDRYFEQIPNIKEGETFTGTIYLKPSNERTRVMLEFKGDTGGYILQRTSDTIIEPNKEGYASVTATAPKNATMVRISIRHMSGTTPENTVQFKEVKVEQGSTATPYTPAPEDVKDNIQSVNDLDIISQKHTVNGESAVDGIEIGGRNLILNSRPSSSENWSTHGASVKYESDTLLATNNVGGSYPRVRQTGSQNKNIADIKKGEKYTLSYLAKRTESKNTDIRISKANSTNAVYTTNVDVSTEWQEFEHSFGANANSNDDVQLEFWINSHGATDQQTLYLKNIKLEKGTKATDWTPAPEDNPYDALENNLYKTNILLSEPLRSVGDVKDRLFRDSDGLWKVERNVAEMILDSSSSLYTSGAASYEAELSTNRYLKPSNATSGIASKDMERCSHLPHVNNVWAQTSILSGTSVNAGQFHIRIPNEVMGVVSTDSGAVRTTKMKQYFDEQKDSNKPFTIQYILKTPTIETLSDDLQTKLNNIVSFSKGDYVYTLQPDKSEILTNDVLEELAPTLHARFKSTGWYRNFSISVDSKDSTQQTINQLKSNKARVDAQYKEVYDNYTMSSGLKTGLSNAKTEYNTKYSLLITHLEVLVQLPSDVKPTVAQRSNVDSAFRDYTVALQEFEEKYQEILSTVESRLSNAELKITDDAITSTVVKSTTYKNDLTGKVSTDEIISRINQTAEEISIDAKKIDLIGAVTAETMSIDSLSAITANLGTVTAGVIRSKDNGINIDLDNSTIDLAVPLTINAKPVATQEEVDDKVDDLDAKIEQKADTEYVTEFADNIEEQLSDFVTIEGYEEEIGEINSTLSDYKDQLEAGEITRDQAIEDISTLLDRTSIIETNLGEFTQKWNFLETSVTMGDEGILVGDIASDTGIRISSGQIDFIDNGIIVAEITGQHMRINRGIFVQSATIGEHKIETIAGGHTIWQWISGEED